MRPISDALRDKFLSALQTRANDADPRANVWIARAQTPLTDSDQLEITAIPNSADPDRCDVAVSSSEKAYVARITGSTICVHSGMVTDDLDDMTWSTETIAATNPDDVAVAFVEDGSGRTVGEPWIFWADGGKLYAQRAGDAATRAVIAVPAGDVWRVAAISGLRSGEGVAYGLTVFFVSGDSWEDICWMTRMPSGPWSNPDTIASGPSGVTWTDIAAFRTRDGRLGLQALADDGTLYELFTAPSKREYLRFTSNSSFTLKAKNKGWDGEIEYSLDGDAWAIWGGWTITAGHQDDYVIHLRGTGNTKISSYNYWFELTGSDVECYGNIEMLLDYKTVEAGEHPPMGDGCFERLFEQCTALKRAPELGSTILSEYCYQLMFFGCTALTTAPALPATTLAGGCYYQMFMGCASLTAAPELPATALAGSCYRGMFSGCTALTAAPELPATALAGSCYSGMFYDCASLTAAPALPATALAGSCYELMFRDCTALATAPALPATSLAADCYSGMFKGCTSLTAAPALPATVLFYECYYEMFRGCTALATAPSIMATELDEDCCRKMFEDCTSLINPPVLRARTMKDGCYLSMFKGCTSLITIPNLSYTVIDPLQVSFCFHSMFKGCSILEVSQTQGGDYIYSFTLPWGASGSNTLDMFADTAGPFTGWPTNTTYYVKYPLIE